MNDLPVTPDLRLPSQPQSITVRVTGTGHGTAPGWAAVAALASRVREDVCNNSKNPVKVRFGISKNAKKRTYGFRGDLITPIFNTQLPNTITESQYR